MFEMVYDRCAHLGIFPRICPGQHLAEPVLFLCIAMTLATFNITKARDEHNRVIEPELEWMSGAIRFGVLSFDLSF